VETYARHHIPARVGLPIELHVLTPKQTFVADVAVLVNGELRRGRRHDRAVERYRVRTVAVLGGLAPVPVEQVRPDEQRRAAKVTRQVGVEIVIEDQAILVLRVRSTAQVRMQKSPDVSDMSAGYGCQ